MSAEREIRIFINSVRYEVEASLFSDENEEEFLENVFASDTEPEKMQIKTVGAFRVEGNRAIVSYSETEVTGMEGSLTEISFDMRDTGIITMTRTGAVSTALVFEKGKRHHCVYQTPYMPFEVCVRTLNVKNSIDTNGCLELEYVVEIRGAKAEKNKFSIRIMD